MKERRETKRMKWEWETGMRKGLEYDSSSNPSIWKAEVEHQSKDKGSPVYIVYFRPDPVIQ